MIDYLALCTLFVIFKFVWTCAQLQWLRSAALPSSITQNMNALTHYQTIFRQPNENFHLLFSCTETCFQEYLHINTDLLRLYTNGLQGNFPATKNKRIPKGVYFFFCKTVCFSECILPWHTGANTHNTFEIGAVYAKAPVIHYGLLMDRQHPMKMTIFAYLHID